MHLLVSKSIAFLELLFIYLKSLFIWPHQVLVVACSVFIAACRIFPCDAQASLVVACSLSRLVQGLSGCPIACGILVLCPGIVPMPPCIGRQILKHWTPREVPQQIIEEYLTIYMGLSLGSLFHCLICLYANIILL